MTVNVAIDGPAGAGKSTIAREAAKRLHYIYVDTGAMYRALALHMLRESVDTKDLQAVEKALEGAEVSIRYEDGAQQVFLNGENVTALLRSGEVSSMASVVSAIAAVRAHLLKLQRDLAARHDVIMDGRDIGTTILPDALVKIYLDADSSVRAKRRHLELIERGEEADLSEIEAQIIERDKRDMNRAVSPLKRAEDAILLDSSNLTPEEVVGRVIGLVKEKTGSAL